MSIQNVLKLGSIMAIITLAASIFYAANALLRVNKTLPEIIQEVHAMNTHVDTITQKSIPDILKVVPKITDQINNIQSKIPMVVSETQALRTSTIPQMLEQVESVQQEIPRILSRVDAINTQVPNILMSVSDVTRVAHEALVRIDSMHQQIPEVLATVQTTNDSISSYIMETKVLIREADEVSRDAGKNVGRGFLGGVLATPFDVTKSMGRFVFGKRTDIKEEEAREVEAQALLFLNRNTEETLKYWEHPKREVSGTIKVLRTFMKKGRWIKKLKVSLTNADHVIKTAKVYFFRKDNGQWAFLR